MLIERKAIEIPEGVEAKIEGKVVTIRGEKGELRRDFSFAPVTIREDNGKIFVEAYWPRKKEKAIVGTIASHIRNMIKGVTKGFTYKLKIVFAHFPIFVEVRGRKVWIKNFCGERRPRIAKIVGNVSVKVEGDDVIVQGINLEEVSQTAANIQQATKIKKKDPRIFLDGIYLYSKE
jgi:large subunit ribosomal protein L6